MHHYDEPKSITIYNMLHMVDLAMIGIMIAPEQEAYMMLS
jgi:hypothetical protein